MATQTDRLDALLQRHDRTFCAELSIDIASGQPAALFQWLVASNLYSTRIAAPIATAAARALFEEGLTSAAKLREASWEQRVKLLNEAGYARMDERYSTILGQMSAQVIEFYDGDLRSLRRNADGKVSAIKAALTKLEGIGPAGADIFRREAQLAWPELAPFMDKKAKAAARDLDLPDNAGDLQNLAGDRFVTAVAALVRTDLDGDAQAILEAAA